MNFEWFVSLRYLRAKRKQTFISVISFISIGGVTLGVAALILVLAIMTGFHDGVRQQILGNVPHILFQKHGFGLKGYQEIGREIQESSNLVQSIAPYLSQQAMLLSNSNVSAVSVKGVEVDNKIFNLDMMTYEDKNAAELLFNNEARLPGIVISVESSVALGVSLGDTVNVIPPMFTMTPFGMIPKMKPFQLVGIFRQSGGFFETYYAYISLPHAQSFLDMKGEVTGLEIEATAFDRTAQLAAQLRSNYDYPFVVRTWEDMFGSFLSALRLEKLGLFIVLGIIVLVAAFNIATTLIMVVMEKNRDIAILRSMGAKSGSIMRIFILEGLIIGGVGTTLGTSIGLFLAKNADTIIKGLENLLGVSIFDQAVYGMSEFPSKVVSSDVVAVALMALIISLLATVYPAWHAARMDPAESLKYE
ncbi:MAG: lipoprotein-releasing ABC transporter permease subunit [Desulfuromonadales bacterium]|nr:lipoprotein-releasing ABC transporter permease subunit [Desulfuromonadales bacterium]